MIADLGVRCEFGAAVRFRPGFRSADQSSAYASAPLLRLHVPAFNEGYSIAGAALGVCSDREFDEADCFAAPIERQKNFDGFADSSGEVAVDVAGVFARLRGP
jgi:hypothetical protein